MIRVFQRPRTLYLAIFVPAWVVSWHFRTPLGGVMYGVGLVLIGVTYLTGWTSWRRMHPAVVWGSIVCGIALMVFDAARLLIHR